MGKLKILTCVAALGVAGAACAPPPPPPPPPPPEVWFAEGCYGSDLGGVDFSYVGPESVIGNASVFSTTDGSCSSSPTETQVVRATNENDALAVCQGLSSTFSAVGNLQLFGYDVPSDVWGCA